MTVVRLADAKPKRPSLPEIGRPGTQFMFGFLRNDEYVPELIGDRGLVTYDKMRRSDGMVYAALEALKLPLLSTTWPVKPATTDNADVAIATAFDENIHEGMSHSFKEHLRQALTHCDFGFAVFEPVWEIRESDVGPVVRLRKLAPRLQRTIRHWDLADDGGLKGVKQAIYGSSSFKSETIPVKKLLVFPNEKEGANWVGKSALRPAYKHWYIKDQLYKIDAIAAERHGVGIPVIDLPENADDAASMNRAEEIGASVRSHEKGYVVNTFGWKFSLAGMGQGRAMNLLPIIQHHDRGIALSVLAPQLTLGERPEGSFALSEDQSSFFMMVQRARADFMCDIYNRYLIPKWVDFNYRGVRKYPKLTVGKIETRNVEKVINAIATAVQAGAMTYSLDLENALRDLANLPHQIEEAALAPKPPAPAPTVDE